ncbi:MAG: MurR/RpiR family transcriptional regulator [Clostridia bacterium]|nr:MurR/RpiR family transcriptional regulator [Clostridia bacterium]MBQ3228421.1 MurR/RpiR family transcriptional regulator [Clostridia bacterium]MBR4061904.1 MurR/RpiR family transcriptional regulator [Clostridia bacterium]MBR6579402.1 MurR/RpiR family transcriptional regulator [Clostridia bacterium]
MKRNLIAMIEEGMPTFSKGQKRIANYILEHYDKAAYMTASKMGALVGVSESTVVRFAIELGFEGYPEMQKSLQELIRMKLTSVQRVEVTNSLIGEGDVLEKILMSDAEKIRRTLEEVDREAFEAAVDAIVAADKIYIIGVRSSSSLAGFLNFNFRMIFDNVKFVQTTSGSEMFEQIMSIGPNDVMIAISFPRYSKRIVNAVEYAHNAGADVISLTDSHQSPIAGVADQLLLARSDLVSFVDSLVAPLSIINAIIVAVSRKKMDDIRVRFDKLEKIWDEYEVYDKAHE